MLTSPYNGRSRKGLISRPLMTVPVDFWLALPEIYDVQP
jgi:hypothetical protein